MQCCHSNSEGVNIPISSLQSQLKTVFKAIAVSPLRTPPNTQNRSRGEVLSSEKQGNRGLLLTRLE